jgi:hypothetical protein
MRHIATYQDWRNIQESQAYIESGVINEGWVSDWLHVAADLVSIAADIVVPGSGAVIDIVQAISYFLEAFAVQDKDPTSAGASALSGLVTLGSLALVGPMQALATEMKLSIATVRNGVVKGASPSSIKLARTASVGVVNFITEAIANVVKIGSNISDLVVKAANTKLGTWVISKFGNVSKFTSWIKDTFTVKIPGILKSFSDSLAKLNPAAKGVAGSVDDLTIKKYAKDYTEGKTKSEIIDKAKKIIAVGKSEKDKYLSAVLPSEVKYQQDTTNDYKPKEPISLKTKVKTS